MACGSLPSGPPCRTHPPTFVAGLVFARDADTGRVIYLHPEIVVDNDDIAQSWVLQDGPDRFSVSVQFLQTGVERMRRATKAHLGRPVAILLA